MTRGLPSRRSSFSKMWLFQSLARKAPACLAYHVTMLTNIWQFIKLNTFACGKFLGRLIPSWFHEVMKTRGYKAPNFTLTIPFDPITWDLLKAHATGSMERLGYELIVRGLFEDGAAPIERILSYSSPVKTTGFSAFRPLSEPAVD